MTDLTGVDRKVWTLLALSKVFIKLAAFLNISFLKRCFHAHLPSYAIVNTLAPKSTVNVSPTRTVIAAP